MKKVLFSLLTLSQVSFEQDFWEQTNGPFVEIF